MVFSKCMETLTSSKHPKTILRFNCLGINSLDWVPFDDARENTPVAEHHERSTRVVHPGLREDEEPFADCAVDNTTLKPSPFRVERGVTASTDSSQLLSQTSSWIFEDPENAAARGVKTFAELVEVLLTVDCETSVKLEELTCLSGEDCSLKRELHKGDIILIEKGAVGVAPTRMKIMRELAESQGEVKEVHRAETRIYDVMHPPHKRFELLRLKPCWITENGSGGLICQGFWPSSSKLHQMRNTYSSKENSLLFFVNNYLVIVALKSLGEKETIHINDSTADADLRELIEWVHKGSRIKCQPTDQD